MKKQMVLSTVAAVGALSVLLSLPVRPASAQTVFQAAGPDAASIQGAVDAYRAALGDPNNGNTAQSNLGDPTIGRREINWDGGGGVQTTVVAGNPFTGFLNTRGALFTTPDGTGFVQATPTGLADQFNNPTYGTIFTTFSPFRLFSAIQSNVTDMQFFKPGTGGDPAAATPATTSGFGAVFTDVDQPHGSGSEKQQNRKASTLIEYFDADGDLLFSSIVPASPGDAGLSFFGIVFDDARIARVRITSGNVAPGPDDQGKQDVVMMDDFIYGEPQPLQ